MQQDYIAPRPADLEWADGIVLAIQDEEVPQLAPLSGSGGKRALTLLPNEDELSQAGFVVFSIPDDLNLVEPRDCCRAGRLFAEALRA
jgi:hypothetical protein